MDDKRRAELELTGSRVRVFVLCFFVSLYCLMVLGFSGQFSDQNTETIIVVKFLILGPGIGFLMVSIFLGKKPKPVRTAARLAYCTPWFFVFVAGLAQPSYPESLVMVAASLIVYFATYPWEGVRERLSAIWVKR